MSDEYYENEDTLFENRFTYTAPLLKELYKGMLKWDKRRKINMIMIYILLGINVAMNIVFIIIGNYDLFRLLIVTLVLLAAVAVFRALEPVILSRNVIRSYEKHYNEPMDVYTTFDEDYMTTHDVSLGATQQRALTYDRITSIHESEHFIVLRLDKRQVMSIHKEGFTKGTLPEFRRFIMNKIKEIEEGWDTSVEVDDVQAGAAAGTAGGASEYEAPEQIEQTDVYASETETFADAGQEIAQAQDAVPESADDDISVYAEDEFRQEHTPAADTAPEAQGDGTAQGSAGESDIADAVFADLEDSGFGDGFEEIEDEAPRPRRKDRFAPGSIAEKVRRAASNDDEI